MTCDTGGADDHLRRYCTQGAGEGTPSHFADHGHYHEAEDECPLGILLANTLNTRSFAGVVSPSTTHIAEAHDDEQPTQRHQQAAAAAAEAADPWAQNRDPWSQ